MSNWEVTLPYPAKPGRPSSGAAKTRTLSLLPLARHLQRHFDDMLTLDTEAGLRTVKGGLIPPEGLAEACVASLKGSQTDEPRRQLREGLRLWLWGLASAPESAEEMQALGGFLGLRLLNAPHPRAAGTSAKPETFHKKAPSRPKDLPEQVRFPQAKYESWIMEVVLKARGYRQGFSYKVSLEDLAEALIALNGSTLQAINEFEIESWVKPVPLQVLQQAVVDALDPAKSWYKSEKAYALRLGVRRWAVTGNVGYIPEESLYYLHDKLTERARGLFCDNSHTIEEDRNQLRIPFKLRGERGEPRNLAVIHAARLLNGLERLFKAQGVGHRIPDEVEACVEFMQERYFYTDDHEKFIFQPEEGYEAQQPDMLTFTTAPRPSRKGVEAMREALCWLADSPTHRYLNLRDDLTAWLQDETLELEQSTLAVIAARMRGIKHPKVLP